MGCYPVLFFWLSISRLISEVAVHVSLLLGWVDGYFVLYFDCNGPDCEEQYNICKGKCSHMIENSKSYSKVGRAMQFWYWSFHFTLYTEGECFQYLVYHRQTNVLHLMVKVSRQGHFWSRACIGSSFGLAVKNGNT